MASRRTSSSQDSQAPDPYHSEEARKRQRVLTASGSVHLNQFEDFEEEEEGQVDEEEEVGDRGSSPGTSQRASGRVPGATLPSGNPPSPSGRSANAPGSGLASDSCIQVETDQERIARRRRELHDQRKRDAILGKDSVVSPVAPPPGIIERRTTGGGNDTKGRKTKIVGLSPWEELKAIFVGLATFIAMGTMGQNFQSSFHKQVMAEALKAAIDVVATPGSELERHGGASGFSDDCKNKPAPAGVLLGRYEQLCRTNASVRMNVVYVVFRGVLLS